ncbi:exonuclease SbcC [Nakamurella sp. YIM 132087]|uniref:Exonuclease SbcC n=1 Tax=Nakamurella alba TaxID=2665158 RepID=A0A7K1FQ20_9ACTN|nr:exonuclease SbcC [Nakamurella alba]
MLTTEPLDADDLRAVTAFAVHCATPVLPVFAAARPDDPRPALAVAVAADFANGGRRGKALRDAAFGALAASREVRSAAGSDAALSAMHAAGSAYLHPLAKATQVKHILGSAAHAAVALGLAPDSAPGAVHLDAVVGLSSDRMVDVLRRYPDAPPGGGMVGEWIRLLDRALRTSR